MISLIKVKKSRTVKNGTECHMKKKVNHHFYFTIIADIAEIIVISRYHHNVANY